MAQLLTSLFSSRRVSVFMSFSDQCFVGSFLSLQFFVRGFGQCSFLDGWPSVSSPPTFGGAEPEYN